MVLKLEMALQTSTRCNGFWYEEQVTEELLLRMVFKKVHAAAFLSTFLAHALTGLVLSSSTSTSGWLVPVGKCTPYVEFVM